MVQLIKRRRDILFANDDQLAPRSVVLTTLAGEHYNGDQSVGRALLNILTGIEARIIAAATKRIVVSNPTNVDERFCESFRTDQHYQRFVEFIREFRKEMLALIPMTGLGAIGAKLREMFGRTVTTRVLVERARRLSEARDAGTLRVGAESAGAATLLTGSSSRPKSGSNSGVVVPRNTFYGE